MRRRANRQHNLNIQHLVAIKSALVAHGPAGIEAIKGLFLTGEPRLVWTFSELACDHFPDEAEPVFEALAAASGRLGGWAQG